MDELISEFVDVSYTDELKQEIAISFRLFEKFHFDMAETAFIDLLVYTVNVSNDVLRDRFIAVLNEKLDYILKEHTVVLIPDATITQKNQILTAFHLVQDLEDYTGIIRALESLENDEEILAMILADLCSVDPIDIMVLIESFEPSLLAKLKQYIYAQEQRRTKLTPQINEAIITTLKIFFKLFGQTNLGGHFITSGVSVGEPLELYLRYIEPDAVTAMKPEDAAINILSLIYMSDRGYSNPIDVYREHSAKLSSDLNRISQIEVHLLNLIAKVNEVRTAAQLADRQRQAVTDTGQSTS